MEVNAKCGCGATLILSPNHKGSMYERGYNDDNFSRLERDAVKEAFEKWTRAHSRCGTPREWRDEPTGVDLSQLTPMEMVP